MAAELLHGDTFRSVTEACVVIANWIEEYNHPRPRRALKMKTPAAFAAYCEPDPRDGNDVPDESRRCE